MKQTTADEMLKRLDERKKRGHHIDERLIQAVQAPGNLFMISLEDEASFLSLIWQESDPARLLTPPSQPRTLRDVAGRMVDNSWTFASLSTFIGRPSTQHDPTWFERCKRIDSNFDFDQFDFLAIVAANDSERHQSPAGSFYIFDGIHRALVLAHRVLAGNTIYQPTEALLITPRRN